MRRPFQSHHETSSERGHAGSEARALFSAKGLESRVERVGQNGVSDGLLKDAAGRIYGVGAGRGTPSSAATLTDNCAR
jgi:hypothetical protein